MMIQDKQSQDVQFSQIDLRKTLGNDAKLQSCPAVNPVELDNFKKIEQAIQKVQINPLSDSKFQTIVSATINASQEKGDDDDLCNTFDSPRANSKQILDCQYIDSPEANSKHIERSATIEYLSASANRKQAVANLSAQNLVQPLGYSPRLFVNALTPCKFKMTSSTLSGLNGKG